MSTNPWRLAGAIIIWICACAVDVRIGTWCVRSPDRRLVGAGLFLLLGTLTLLGCAVGELGN